MADAGIPAPQPGPQTPDALPTGPGAAAILAAGIGSLALGVLALAADAFHAINVVLRFFPPAGALSGVTTCTIVIWLAVWVWLARRWGQRDVALLPVTLGAGAMVLAGLLLTFPPVMDWLQRL